jgi:hypothetical protein
MKPMAKARIREILAELEADHFYQRSTRPAMDDRFLRFRQEVEVLGIRCLQFHREEAPEAEIRERLRILHTQAVSTLHPFRPFIERAQAELKD